jgi:hypothetical protein
MNTEDGDSMFLRNTAPTDDAHSTVSYTEISKQDS